MTASRGLNPRRALRGTALERFWQQVDTSAGLLGCWPWQGAKSGPGYGVLAGDDGRNVAAHRLSLEISLGRSLGPGMCACHDCPGGDDRGCVNPAHLFEGTRGDNNRDMVAKGRHWSQRAVAA